jgi:hypothetical protein
MSYEEDFAAAQKLFRAFHHRSAKPNEIIALAAFPTPRLVLEVGRVVTLDYRALGDGEVYSHDFEATRPRLFVSPHGSQAYIIGGSYNFTPRGFVR